MALKVLYITQYSIFSWIKTRKVIQANEMQLFAVFTIECKGQKVCTVCSAEKVIDCVWFGYRAGLCKNKMCVFYLNVFNVVGAYRFSMNWTIGYGPFLIRLNVVVYFFKWKCETKPCWLCSSRTELSIPGKKKLSWSEEGGRGWKQTFRLQFPPIYSRLQATDGAGQSHLELQWSLHCLASPSG